MERIVVRQPVFGRRQDVVGYKILCSSQQPEALHSLDHLEASLKEIENTFLLIGFDRITGNKRAFIDLTRSLFAGETELTLPKDLTIVEISYCMEPADTLLRSCRKLKESGYVIAAGNFIINHEDLGPLVELVDIIKSRPVDMDDGLTRFKESSASDGKRFLAEEVNTRQEFDLALAAGYDYFQGYFFSDPVIISRRDIPQYELTQLRVLYEVNRRDMDYAALEHVIKQDVSLSYKLLKFINSAFFGLRREVSSIKQALALLGEREIKRWTSLVVLNSLGKNKPSELVLASLVRANFCEALAGRVGLKNDASEAFIMGLFSMLDAFLGRPLDELIAEMPLSADIKKALSGQKSKYKRLLDLVLSYERGNLKSFFALAAKLKIKEYAVTDLYLSAIDRAEDALQIYGPDKTDGH
jgi:c-di-GMP-related signal transduction protein